MDMMMYMTMYFYNANYVKFIFPGWNIMGNSTAYWAALFSCAIIGFLVEAISVFVSGMEAKHKL